MFVTKKLSLISVLTLGIGSAAMGQQRFGFDGYDGNTGMSGYDGRSGESVEVIADGSRVSYELPGEDGREGADGYDGQDATACSHGTPANNLMGASGGDGGRGGRGGRGGSGGDVTLYYDAIENLKEVYLNLMPGRGGYGGYGGRAGEGCNCLRSSWQVEVGEELQTFYCNNGARGVRGNQGARGDDGAYGQVKLIGQLDRLRPDITRAELSLTEIASGPVALGRNTWSEQRGAARLFAIGSRVADRYVKFDGRQEVNYGFVWNLERPLEDFADIKLYLTLNRDLSVTWNHTDGFWHVGEEVEREDGGKDYVFSAVAKASEALALNLGEVTGSGAGLELGIEDASGATESFEHEVVLNYYTRYGRYYYRRFRGTVPPEAVEVVQGKIIVKLGQAGVSENYLQPGVYTYLDLTITRKMGNHSAAKRFTTYHQIPE